MEPGDQDRPQGRDGRTRARRVARARAAAVAMTIVGVALALAWRAERRPIPLPLELRLAEALPAAVWLSGFSGREPWGRWTDGAEAAVLFRGTLPARFALRVRARAYGPNAGAPLRVRAGGGAPATLRLGAETEEVDLVLRSPRPTHRIEFQVPHPTSPRSLGQGEDERRLGIGIVALGVREVPE